MKRWGLGCAGALLLALGLYMTWVTSPPNRGRAVIEAARQSSRARYQALQARASNPQENGLLEKDLYPWWGPKSKQVANTPAGRAIDVWRQAYATSATGTQVDHGSRDAAYRRARRDFEKYLPTLTRALSRPILVVPGQPQTLDSEPLNYLAFRSAAQACSGYAESLLADGHPDQAVQAVLSVLRAGGTLQHNDTLMTTMFGVAMQTIATQSIFYSLARGSVSQTTWQALAKTAREALPGPHTTCETLEGEVESVEVAFDNPPGLLVLTAGTPALAGLKLPGLLARERRLYDNLMAEILHRGRTAEVFDLQGLEVTFDTRRWLLGKVGLVASMILPSVPRAAAQVAFNRRRLLGLYTVAALQVQRHQQGRYPAALSELPAAPPGFAWNDPAQFEYAPGRAGFRLLVKLDPAFMTLIKANHDEPGFTRENGGLRFDFPLNPGTLCW